MADVDSEARHQVACLKPISPPAPTVAMPALDELASFTVRYAQTAPQSSASVRFSAPYKPLCCKDEFPAEVFELSRAPGGGFWLRHIETRGGPNALWGLVSSAGVISHVDNCDEYEVGKHSRLTKVLLSMDATKKVIAYVLSRTIAEGARVVIAKRIILQKESNGELTVRRI
jgi:hypothetical protein